MPEPLNAPAFDKKSWGIDVGAGGATEDEDPLPDLYSRCISQTDPWYQKMVSEDGISPTFESSRHRVR